jgi:hypothetical protein
MLRVTMVRYFLQIRFVRERMIPKKSALREVTAPFLFVLILRRLRVQGSEQRKPNDDQQYGSRIFHAILPFAQLWIESSTGDSSKESPASTQEIGNGRQKTTQEIENSLS